MTNLDAVAGLFRIERMTGPLCVDCEQSVRYVRKTPAGFTETICCAGCFTKEAAVLNIVSGQALTETCNVAILMDLTLDPPTIMSLDRMNKQEESTSNIKMADVFNEAGDGRDIVTAIMETLRDAAANFHSPILLYTCLAKVVIITLAGMAWAKKNSLPVILAKPTKQQ